MGETRAKENACISIFPYPGHEVNVFNGLAHLHFSRSNWNPYKKPRIKKSVRVCILLLTYL
jgi:hypothetical protein